MELSHGGDRGQGSACRGSPAPGRLVPALSTVGVGLLPGPALCSLTKRACSGSPETHVLKFNFSVCH